MAYDASSTRTRRTPPPAGLDPFGFSEASLPGRTFGTLAALWLMPWRTGAVIAAEAFQPAPRRRR